MTERSGNERILARWTVDAAQLRDFVREQRIRNKRAYPLTGLLKECEAASMGSGVEIVFREDAIFVGSFRASNMFDDFRVHDTWMHFLGDEGYQIAVPIPPGEGKEAERVATHYRAHFERLNSEAARQYEEERARPTLNNRLLKFTEANFGWVVVGFFFVLIPLLLFVLGVFVDDS